MVPAQFDEAAKHLKILIESRQFRKEKLEEETTATAIRILGETISPRNSDEQRLEAVSLLGKAAAVSTPIAKFVQPVLERGLESPLPSVGAWGSAEDRYYLAKGISVSRARWINRYAAEELARSGVKEKKSRVIWTEIAVGRADSVTEVLGIIARALSAQLANLADAEESAYRKLMRISDALSQSLPAADIATGRGFGQAFSSLVVLAGGGKGAEALKLRKQAALKLLELVILIFRVRFDAIFDSDLYRAVGTVRGWWRPARPPEEIEELAERIVELAFRGLHVLARQGIADKELRQALVAAFGHSTANAAGQKVTGSDPSLDPNLSYWLNTGQSRTETQSGDAVRELSEQSSDELLSRLLLAIDSQEAQSQPLRAVADTLDVYEPAQASLLRSASQRAEVIAQWARALASRRGLSTFGLTGEIVQYDPAIHEASAQIQRLSPVRVRAPGVLRKVEGHPSVLVLKAIVEGVQSGGN